MTRWLKMAVVPLVLGAALLVAGPTSAKAQGFGIQLYGGNYGGNCGVPYGAYGTYYNSYNSFYGSPYSAGFPSFQQYRYPGYGFPYNAYYGGGYNSFYRSHHHHHCR